MLLNTIHRTVFIQKHRPVYFSKHNISETRFCLHHQVKPTQLGPINRASPYLSTPVQHQDGVYKPSKNISLRIYMYETLHQRTIMIEIINGEKGHSLVPTQGKQIFPFNLT
jgi:hypothetical protein